jgi:protein regulator of cytokinesis 1
MLQEYNKLIDNKMQEMKKMSIPQPVAEGDNFYMARPASSNRRISNRSMNGGFGSGSPINRKYSGGFNNTNNNYTALGTSIRRESRKSEA